MTAAGRTEIGMALAESYERSELISFSSLDQSEGSFYCGEVMEVRYDTFRIRYVNVLGQPGEGRKLEAWFSFDEVKWLEWDSPYLRGLTRLHDHHERFSGKSTRPLTSQRSIRAAVRELARNHGFAEVWMDSFCMDVRIVRAGTRSFQITVIGANGEDQGRRLVMYKQVQRLRCKSPHQRAAAFLHTGGEAHSALG